MERELSERQRQILQYIVRHTEEHGYPPTVREIGEAVKLSSSSTVHAHLKALEQSGLIRRDAVLTRAIRVVNYDRPVSSDRGASLDRGTSLDRGASLDGAATSDRAGFAIPPASKRVVSLPLVGRVAAGKPMLAVEDVEDTFPVPKDFLSGGDGFMLRVNGESMVEDGIHNGDCVIVRRQNSADNGDTIVAMVDDEATVKRFYKESGRIRLQPANQSMGPMFYDTIEIVGKVVGLVRRMQ